MFCNGVRNGVRNGGFDKSNLIGFVIREDNGCKMGLSDGAFFMIKHTPF